MAATVNGIVFPGETAEYRAARNRLLEAEIALRREVEAVAVLRRQLPLGGALPEDYVFDASGEHDAPRKLKFSELFAPGKDTLAVYNFMYGPAMKTPCPMCTSIVDALNGTAVHATQRINLAVVAKSPLPRILAFAEQRGWTKLRLLSSAENSYNRDYHGEDDKGNQLPMLNVFVRRDGAIRHFTGSELLFAPTDGTDTRHVDMIWPLWNLLDFTPEGRGERWGPKLSYD